MEHRNLGEADLHQIQDTEYTTRANREGGTFSSSDIGKVSRQTDEDSWYVVTSATPTFNRIDNGEVTTTSTTDATETTAWSYTLGDNSAVYVEAVVVAMETDGSDRNCYKIAGLFYRDGGTATQQGSTASIITAIESDATWAADFDVSSNDVRLRVTGAGSTNVTWSTRVTIDYVV